MPQLISDFRYRPEIDGLRAIAVLAVVFYHAGLGVPGGYIGVDVFFVISGFLITSLIVKDLEAGKFSLVQFWERRIRRILPALVVVVLATLAAGWFLLLHNDYASLGLSASFQSLGVANIYFWRSTGYFAGAAEEKPLLHTWSLAVEEQFYFVLPLLLMGLFAVPALRRRGVLLTLFGVGIVSSLLLSAWSVVHYPSATFYLLPTRAWELLLGCAVALLPAPALARRWREILSIASLAGILLPCFLYTSFTRFPGLAALPPCLGTAIFIWATHHRSPKAARLVGARLLSSPAVVFVGLISYSLYLWHWPLLAFSTYSTLTHLTWGHRVAMALLGFALAVLSWRYVETPFRERRVGASRRSVFAFGAFSASIVLLTGLSLYHAEGVPSRLPAEARRYLHTASDSTSISQLTTEDVLKGEMILFGAASTNSPEPPKNTPGASVDWLMWGDSHAGAALPAFDTHFQEHGLSGHAAIHAGTAPVLDYHDNWSDLGTAAPAFNQAVLDHLNRHRIPNVVLIGRWSIYSEDPAPASESPPFDTSLIKTIRSIREAGAQPWILLEVPTHEFHIPKGLALAAIRQQSIEPLCARAEQGDRVMGSASPLIAQLRAAGARILDPRPAFLSEDGSYYRVEMDGVVLYRDSNHLSTKGAAKILLPLLQQSISGT